jgi:hypothetical protein
MSYKLPVNYNELNQIERREVRLQYIKEQNNKCFYCNKSLDLLPPKRITDKKINKRLFPESFFKFPIHLQHNHGSGMTEGAVHNYCNAVLWQYEGK